MRHAHNLPNRSVGTSLTNFPDHVSRWTFPSEQHMQSSLQQRRCRWRCRVDSGAFTLKDHMWFESSPLPRSIRKRITCLSQQTYYIQTKIVASIRHTII